MWCSQLLLELSWWHRTPPSKSRYGYGASEHGFEWRGRDAPRAHWLRSSVVRGTQPARRIPAWHPPNLHPAGARGATHCAERELAAPPRQHQRCRSLASLSRRAV